VDELVVVSETVVDVVVGGWMVVGVVGLVVGAWVVVVVDRSVETVVVVEGSVVVTSVVVVVAGIVVVDVGVVVDGVVVVVGFKWHFSTVSHPKGSSPGGSTFRSSPLV